MTYYLFDTRVVDQVDRVQIVGRKVKKHPATCPLAKTSRGRCALTTSTPVSSMMIACSNVGIPLLRLI